MTTVEQRIELLETLTDTKAAAYSDRCFQELNALVRYAFKRVGGGRELKYSEWNLEAIEKLSDEKFNDIIQRLTYYKNFYDNTKDMTMVDFLTYISGNNGSNK